MSNRLGQTTPRKMIKALKKCGFWIRSIEGSHYIMTNGIRKTSVPYHSYELSRDLMMSIIKQAGLTIEDFRPYL